MCLRAPELPYLLYSMNLSAISVINTPAQAATATVIRPRLKRARMNAIMTPTMAEIGFLVI